MALTKIRSYREEVIKPLFALSKRNLNFSTEFMGSVKCEPAIYPLFCVTIAAKGAVNPKDVLISGGVHGEDYFPRPAARAGAGGYSRSRRCS